MSAGIQLITADIVVPMTRETEVIVDAGVAIDGDTIVTVDAISALRRDPRGMQALTRMGRDIAGLQKTDADPVTQDWKALTLPMMWQNDIHKIHMFYRRQHSDQDDDSSDAKKGDSTRFIFDLNLDRMGDMQIDGLMKDKRLDLILRTREKPFSPPMQAHHCSSAKMQPAPPWPLCQPPAPALARGAVLAVAAMWTSPATRTAPLAA